MKFCPKCNSKLEIETEYNNLEEIKSLGYPYVCPICDENMYTIEAINKGEVVDKENNKIIAEIIVKSIPLIDLLNYEDFNLYECVGWSEELCNAVIDSMNIYYNDLEQPFGIDENSDYWKIRFNIEDYVDDFIIEHNLVDKIYEELEKLKSN